MKKYFHLIIFAEGRMHSVISSNANFMNELIECIDLGIDFKIEEQIDTSTSPMTNNDSSRVLTYFCKINGYDLYTKDEKNTLEKDKHHNYRLIKL